MNLIRLGTAKIRPLYRATLALLILTVGFESTANAGPVCERSTAIKKAFEARLNLKCQDITEEDLQRITELWIAPTNPMHLESDDLNGLTSLNRLTVVATGLPNGLPSGFLAPVSNTLESLSLTLSSKTFSSKTLEGLKQLKLLDLAMPNLIEFKGGIFADLASLNELMIRNVGITSVPVDLLNGLDNLKTLRFHRTDIAILPAGLLTPVPDLETFQFWTGKTAQNTLSSIEPNFFSGLKSLRSIQVKEHGLRAIPKDLFHGLSNLESIDLSYGHLLVLLKDQFRGLKKLKKLDLLSNDLWDFRLEWLADSAKTLEYLSLYRLPLTVELDIIQIQLFKNIKYLVLGDINLKHIPEHAFSSLPDLGFIRLNKNQISALPDDFLAQSQKVVYVELASNPMERIPNATMFSNLPTLDSLVLPTALWDEDFENIVKALPKTVKVTRN